MAICKGCEQEMSTGVGCGSSRLRHRDSPLAGRVEGHELFGDENVIDELADSVRDARVTASAFSFAMPSESVFSLAL